ncbi:pyruvate dehydrogenase E1 component alpha subunit [Blastococcus colisei]|uniref:Pyruvate dehydrogenase E1 component alpha subunit n=1 Tax=Blastococcus colisei TaxID=1564162 RepID=A0A543PG67_9ACTN|nr:thiamine pyrophosphate-dependent dehydrogenase E1 component subunit alpha [Blastococcus colisei]TQN43064.1 pyruvate dehydrogenase E1 component alpha subunit [Blastococcus colisei]
MSTPATASAVRHDGETVRRLYRTMALIRQFETTASRLMASGKLPGSVHLSIGQEGVAAGICDALEPDDFITSTHRGHGHCIAKGGGMEPMMAELFGRSGGYCGGRSGSMHIADPKLGILGANAIVGAGIPIAVGGAFSARARGTTQVAVAFFGEGAVAEGAFHESMNIAALWKLPVIFVCENNGYAELSPVSVHLSAQDVVDFAAPYRMAGVQVDGNDVLAVRATAEEAVARARAGEGPTLIECRTYRWHGHFEGDPQRYREKSEVAAWREKDPLVRLMAEVSDDSALAADLEAATAEARELVDAAVRWAEADAHPETSAILADVYRDPTGFEAADVATERAR